MLGIDVKQNQMSWPIKLEGVMIFFSKKIQTHWAMQKHTQFCAIRVCMWNGLSCFGGNAAGMPGMKICSMNIVYDLYT